MKWFAYSVVTSSKIIINLVCNDAITTRAKLTTELTNLPRVIEEVLCGTVSGDDVEDAMVSLENGAWHDTGLPHEAMGPDSLSIKAVFKRVESRAAIDVR